MRDPNSKAWDFPAKPLAQKQEDFHRADWCYPGPADLPTETPAPPAARPAPCPIEDCPTCDEIPVTLRSAPGQAQPLPKNTGRKDDAAKLRLDLVAWRALQEIARVLTFGANKYGDNNWHHVPNARQRYFAAALRHLTAWRLGEKADPDTGASHLAHAGACVLFLLSMEVGFDPDL